MKHHTFQVTCVFTMQYTFDESEIGPDGEPSEEAVLALEEELQTHLHPNYGIDQVDVEAGLLLGVVDDTEL
jgi:hypothetical protein